MVLNKKIKTIFEKYITKINPQQFGGVETCILDNYFDDVIDEIIKYIQKKRNSELKKSNK